MTPKLGLESARQSSDAIGSSQAAIRAPEAGLSPGSLHVGTLAGFDGGGHPLVDFPSNPFLAAIPARSCVDLSPGDIGSEIVLSFEKGDFAHPLLMGCLRSPAVEENVSVDLESILAAASLGQDVTLTALRSLTLRCGRASLTLTRDGLVRLNGTYIETRASGTNRIQGGSVRIN